MIEFNNLKNSYISVIQWGMLAKESSYSLKQGNEILHKFCENLVDNSDHSEMEKLEMKRELEILKELLSKEIEKNYDKG